MKIISEHKYILSTFVIFVIFGFYISSNNESYSHYVSPLEKNWYTKSLGIETAEATEKIKILVVPGHEPDFGGTEFGNIKEREMTVELGQKIKNLLENNPRYDVYITRDKTSWNETFLNYFSKDWKEIISWEKSKRKAYSDFLSSNHESRPPQIVKHNKVSDDVAIRLYGITRWANENNIDLILHIHFNDDAEHRKNVAGKYSGFAIYVPVNQFANGEESHEVAKNIMKYLSLDNGVSSLPQESTGIVDEARLIAIGANNTANPASILIEYGYIYEPRFLNDNNREFTLNNLATETYLGLDEYFKLK
ncbi:MAG: N-acetylmuramoyl-L-alanine amidase [Nitrospira sp.]